MRTAGAILAGGSSRRMGSPKALLPVMDVPMAVRVGRVLRAAGADPVVLVGAGTPTAATLDMEWIADLTEGEGPLVGLATALSWAQQLPGVEAVMVAACDQVALEPATFEALTAAVSTEGRPGPPSGESLSGAGAVSASVAVGDDGRVHPFPSVWRVELADRLVELVASGERRALAVMSLGAVEVLRPASELVDLDTPEDLSAFRRDHESGG